MPKARLVRSAKAILFGVVLGCLMLGSTAEARSPRAAQAFVDAYVRAGDTMRLSEDEVRAGYEALPIDACRRVVTAEGMPPKRHEEQLTYLLLGAAFQPLIAPALAAQEQLMAALDAVATRDPVLRSMRARERRALAILRASPILAEPCALVERWVISGYRRDVIPPGVVAAIKATMTTPRVARRGMRADRRAFRHMQVLGVPAAEVRAARSVRGIGSLLPADLIEGVFVFVTPDGKRIN